MFISCGTEDYLYWTNERFIERFGEKFSIHVVTEPGVHSWRLWNKHIEMVLEWLQLEKAARA